MKARQRPVDDESIELLLRKFMPRARSITASFGIPAEDGEDLLQETLVTFLHKRAEVSSPEAWLATALRRRCLMYWRSRRRSLLCSVDASVLDLMAEEAPVPQAAVDVRHDVDRTLDRMPQRCRSLLEARYRQGMSPAETARSLGYRSSGIYKLIERCLSAFTQRLTLKVGEC